MLEIEVEFLGLFLLMAFCGELGRKGIPEFLKRKVRIGMK